MNFSQHGAGHFRDPWCIRHRFPIPGWSLHLGRERRLMQIHSVLEEERTISRSREPFEKLLKVWTVS
jgi:hypothetical protein